MGVDILFGLCVYVCGEFINNLSIYSICKYRLLNSKNKFGKMNFKIFRIYKCKSWCVFKYLDYL